MIGFWLMLWTGLVSLVAITALAFLMAAPVLALIYGLKWMVRR